MKMALIMLTDYSSSSS